MASGSQLIVSSVRVVDDISKQTAEHSESVLAFTEEQTASVQQIAAASQSLASFSEDLQRALGKFRL